MKKVAAYKNYMYICSLKPLGGIDQGTARRKAGLHFLFNN